MDNEKEEIEKNQRLDIFQIMPDGSNQECLNEKMIEKQIDNEEKEKKNNCGSHEIMI